eukprot:4042096-Prymnesium_polylepis.1
MGSTGSSAMQCCPVLLLQRVALHESTGAYRSRHPVRPRDVQLQVLIGHFVRTPLSLSLTYIAARDESGELSTARLEPTYCLLTQEPR